MDRVTVLPLGPACHGFMSQVWAGAGVRVGVIWGWVRVGVVWGWVRVGVIWG